MPRVVTEEIQKTIVWAPVLGPVDCKCGHQHYGRKSSDDAELVPQWNFCEDPECNCTSLRRIN